ncbi:PTS-dependent dihydroxyacetone kinase, dihydroxyacetone-binding subunit dhaK [Serratia rubidaea]|uniref:PTS-dependent dihydroxyacetone kinase, dihydroxyacetone-binding subunit dhaK n=1 Tax=Serratia rubidaea TaxID=61652 RepID=A0A4V6JIA3_SERRU|nr:PTS-dependent dihydroxyacetone kinase, dihydroxyacetone-binding subunit dhaK [Serratia rubidaea]
MAVATVLVDDDVAVKDSLFTAGRRGVANTVLLEKLLGAAAARGDSLDELVTLGHRLNNQGHSIRHCARRLHRTGGRQAVVYAGG